MSFACAHDLRRTIENGDEFRTVDGLAIVRSSWGRCEGSIDGTARCRFAQTLHRLLNRTTTCPQAAQHGTCAIHCEKRCCGGCKVRVSESRARQRLGRCDDIDCSTLTLLPIPTCQVLVHRVHNGAQSSKKHSLCDYFTMLSLISTTRGQMRTNEQLKVSDRRFAMREYEYLHHVR